MAIIAVNCPQCSASVEIDKFGKGSCAYCGAVVKEESNQNDAIIVNVNYSQPATGGTVNHTAAKPNKALWITLTAVCIAVVLIFATIMFVRSLRPSLDPYEGAVARPGTTHRVGKGEVVEPGEYVVLGGAFRVTRSENAQQGSYDFLFSESNNIRSLYGLTKESGFSF